MNFYWIQLRLTIFLINFVSKGGTDAGAAHVMNNGVPSAVIGVCARYIHTHQTVFHIDDYAAAKEMVLQIARTLDRSTFEIMKTIKSIKGVRK